MALKYPERSDESFNVTSQKPEDAEFEQLLKAVYEKEKKFKAGEVVPGRVISVTKEHVLVDIGFKAEGIIEIEQFGKDSDGKFQVQAGDELLVYIEAVEDDNGNLILSKEKADRYKIWDEIAEVYEKGAIIEGTVVDKVKGGLVVDIGVKAFLPGSQIGLLPVKDLDSFAHQTIKCKIVKFNKRRGNIVLSRRAVMEQERDSRKSEILSTIEEGQNVEGIIKNVTDYGVFIDLGGMDGLLHVTDISWGRAENPQKMFRIGDPIKVKILKYDREKQRVSLGLKQLSEDPWSSVALKFPPGSVVKGKVVSLTNYGAFISLEEGVEGLIHVSEMSWNKKVKNPNKLLTVGQEVESKVLEVDAENKKISLGLKQLEANPWESLVYKYPIGSTVKGTVSNITDFGIFVTVEDGIDGLIHISDLSWTGKIKNPGELYTRGQEIDAKVLHIDVDHEKFSLGTKQLTPDPWEKADKRFAPGTQVNGKIVRITDFGAFVEVAPDLEGLIHISEISEDKIESVSSILSEGQEVQAEVINIDMRERKLSLSIKSLKRREGKQEMKKYLGGEESLSSTLGEHFKKSS
ncbi:MAG: ribosomal protein [Bacteriovoracaceae bacterium]|nr:ribosomal protein [Bacteriovoracaceae bacterium]